MKTTMKLFAALTIMLGFAVTTFGQVNIGASANVVTAVSVLAGADLQFGNVTPGNSKTIGTSTPVVLQGTIAGSPEAAGTYIVNKGANSQVTLTFALPSNLTKGSDNLPINYTTYNSNVLGAIDVAGTLTSFVPSNGLQLAISNSAYASAFAALSFGVRIGGTVVPDALQPSGAYAGTITMTATYN